MLNQAPCEWTIRSLVQHIKEGPQSSPDGTHWEPARPYGMFTLTSRVRLAWLVFKGEADALRWPGQSPKAY